MPTTLLMLRAGPGAIVLLTLAVLLCGGQAHAQAGTPSDEHVAVVQHLGELLIEHYVFEDVARSAAEQLEQARRAGRFSDAHSDQELSQRLTAVLQEATHDKHLRVRPLPAPPPEMTEQEHAFAEAQELERARQDNFGFEQVLRLPGNVGLLDLRGFSGFEPAHATAVGAMGYLATCDALVVDLRQNGGGSPEMVQLLCSYFFAQRTHLNSLYYRATGVSQEYWTLDELPGPRLADVPLFVLTSAHTFSAAEEFTYNLATRERATIVGETTGGGAHPGDQFTLSDDLAVFISTGRAINPVTGTNWEGTGVAPDVACPADDALDRALELAQRAAQDHRDAREAGLRG